MRLSEIREILNNNLESLISTIENVKQVPVTGLYKLINLKAYRKAINKIEKTEVFTNNVESIKASPIFENSQDTFDINSHELSLLQINTRAIIDAGDAFIDTIDNALPVNSEKVINIKLPPSLNTFSELSRFFKELEKAFAPIIDCGEEATVEGFEPGSKWINIVMGSIFAVTTAASLSWSGAVVAKKIQEFRMQDEAIRGMGLKNDFLTALKEGQEKQMKLLIEAETGAICKATGREYTTEEINRIKLSIEIFGNLILKGTEVHPSLIAPEDVENLFPKDTPFNLIESKTKLLDENAGPSSK